MTHLSPTSGIPIAVFGVGYVGAVSAACLASDGHRVVAVDINEHKLQLLRAGISPIIEPGLDELISAGVSSGRLRATADAGEAIACSDLSLVCVGTPSLPNGGLDLSHVVRVCEQIGAALPLARGFHTVLLRSTILPGTTTTIAIPALERASGLSAGRDFGVAFCPEFLREGSAVEDYYAGPVIVGGSPDERVLAAIRAMNTRSQLPVLPTDAGVAEMLKYASNAWHATKVVFANEMGTIAKSLGVDGRRVMQMLCEDKRLNISPAYLRPGFAFGGSCLPKDLRALLQIARQNDVCCPMLEAAPVSNEMHIRRAMEMVCAAGRRRVGFIGLSFKEGTDDLRESPAVDLAERLFGKGYDIRIYDANVSLGRLTGANLAAIEARIPHLAALLSDDAAEVARHGDTLVLAHHEPNGALALRSLRSDQLVIDMTCAPQPNFAGGGRYTGLCW